MQSDYILRKATLADVETVTQLTHAAYEKYIERMGRKPRPMLADYAELIAKDLTWLVLQNDAPIGALVLLEEADAMLIYSIAIAPSHQRKGLGRMLLRFAEQQAQLKGYEKIKLYTNERMDDNVDYYKRFGYIETHREPYGETIVVYMAKQVEHYENI